MLPTMFWTIDPAGNKVQYSAFPAGNPPAPSWTTIPNYLNQTASLSVNIQTSFLTPTSGATVTLNGTLPTGWAFDGTTLSYNGTSTNANPSTLSFTALYNNFYSTSNSFSIQGKGSLSPDTTPPTIPVGTVVSGVTQTTATIGGYPSSDPAVPGTAFGGMQQYNLTVSGATGSPFTITSPVGNEPLFSLTDIGAPSPVSTLTQTGSNLAITSYGSQLYGTADQCAFVNQQLTGTSWFFSCQISSFSSPDNFGLAALCARQSLAANSMNVAMITFPFNNAKGVCFQNRASAGASSVQTGNTANSASPIWLGLVRSADTYTGYWSLTQNGPWTQVGQVTQVMGSTLYVGCAVANENDTGVQISVTFNQVNLQTTANWTQNLSGLHSGDTYNYSVTAQDVDGNISSAATGSFNTTGGTTGTLQSDLGPWYGSYLITVEGSVSGGTYGYANPSWQAYASGCNVNICNSWPGIEGNYTSYATKNYSQIDGAVFAAGQAKGVNARNVKYFMQEQASLAYNNGGSGTLYRGQINWLNTNNGWLRNGYPSGAIVAGDTSADGVQCISAGGPVDSNNRDINEFSAWYNYNIYTQGNGVSLFSDPANYAPNTNGFGVFHDNQFWQARVTGSWEHTSATQSGAVTQSLLQGGNEQWCISSRALWGSSVVPAGFSAIMCGNVDIGVPVAAGNASSSNVFGWLNNYDCNLLEYAIGPGPTSTSNSAETAAFGNSNGQGFLNFVNALKVQKMCVNGTGRVMIQSRGGHNGYAFSTTTQTSFTTTDWAAIRYCETLAWIFDCMIAFAANNGQTNSAFYSDTAVQNGSWVWKGAATQASPTAATSGWGGLWSRTHQNALDIVNPTGSSIILTVGSGAMIPSGAYRLPTAKTYNGTTNYCDPTVYTGATLTSNYSIPAWTGITLVFV